LNGLSDPDSTSYEWSGQLAGKIRDDAVNVDGADGRSHERPATYPQVSDEDDSELDSRADTATSSDQVRMMTPLGVMQGPSTSIASWVAHLEHLERIAIAMRREMSDLDISGAFLNAPAPVNEYVDDGTLY